MRYFDPLFTSTLLVSACCKEDLSTLKSWKNPKNIATGLANGNPWNGTVKLGLEDNGMLSFCNYTQGGSDPMNFLRCDAFSKY